MKSHDPFKHLQRDVGHEAASLLLYINMAQAVQVACDYLNKERSFGPEEILKVIDTFTTALTWMDMGGIRERFPDLAAMPEEVDPIMFMGGNEGCDAWIDEQLAIMKEDEVFKVDSLFN